MQSNIGDSDTQKNDSDSFEVESSGAFAPVLGCVQDHPVEWDWRLIVAFVAISTAALYML